MKIHPIQLLSLILLYSVCHAQKESAAPELGVTPVIGEEHMSYIENEHIRLGANTAIGGSITYLSTKDGPNMINTYDWGRQIQMSFYSYPKPFEPNGQKPNPDWRNIGWNPIQSGDCYGNKSEVLEHRNDGSEIYIKCRPMHWPLNNYPGKCIFECWYRLDGNQVVVKSRLTNDRDDTTQYPARRQELPAIYTNGPWYKLVTYMGDAPFSNAAPTTLVDKDDGRGWPWRNFYTPEHWVALLDENDEGLGIYLPGACRFTGGFAGQFKGEGGPKSFQTGYMGPTIREILDHNIVYDYSYNLIIGSLQDIREQVYSSERKRSLPAWNFSNNRQSWIYENIKDTGWPIKDGLRFNLGPDNARLFSPKLFWKASSVSQLSLSANFKTESDTAKILIQPYDRLDAGDWAQWGPERYDRPKPKAVLEIPFKIVGDGKARTINIDLASHPEYKGSFSQVMLQLPTGKGLAIIHSLELR